MNEISNIDDIIYSLVAFLFSNAKVEMSSEKEEEITKSIQKHPSY